MKCCFITLGCDKNTVDSEKIFELFLEKSKAEIVINPEDADVVLLNTCAFIKDAKRESIDYINYLVSLKKKNKIKKIFVTGCLVTENSITGSYEKLFKDVDVTLPFDKYLYSLNDVNDRVHDILSFSSFLKVCDGCNKLCSYCIIPHLRGKLKSSTLQNLLSESKKLAKNGVKELNIVGQDVLSYGFDLDKKNDFDLNKEKPIVTLVNEISKITNIKWIRLLYCYPEEIDDSVINLIKSNKKVLKYIDMPIQHVSDKILKLMNRQTNKDSIVKIVNKLREKIPEICIRTTILVGFPGETEEDFNELVDFVKEIKFDKLGVFTYSREKLSKSYDLPNQIDEKIKTKRKKTILKIQEKIVKELNEKKVGNIYNCLVEYKISDDENLYIVRPYFDARDIDDKVFVKSKKILYSGSFVNVKITKSLGYDLIGEIV